MERCSFNDLSCMTMATASPNPHSQLCEYQNNLRFSQPLLQPVLWPGSGPEFHTQQCAGLLHQPARSAALAPPPHVTPGSSCFFPTSRDGEKKLSALLRLREQRWRRLPLACEDPAAETTGATQQKSKHFLFFFNRPENDKQRMFERPTERCRGGISPLMWRERKRF